MSHRSPFACSIMVCAVLAACGDTMVQAPEGEGAAQGCPPELAATGLDLTAARAAYRDNLLRHELRMMEALRPGSIFSALETWLAARGADKGLCLADLQQVGRIVFEHELTFEDGLGSGQAAQVGQSPFRRVQQGLGGGPETISCTSCHWRGGPAGAGTLPDNTYLLGDGDHVSSADARNPPALHGVGVVEKLANEMSAELAAQRRDAIETARARGQALAVDLQAKGVSFGTLRVAADGTVDAAAVSGVDDDLQVRPFGWKGNFATLVEFIRESYQVHFGIQAEALVEDPATDEALLGTGPADDPDGDGMRRELPDALLLSVVAHLAALPLPVVEPWTPVFELEPVAEPLSAPTSRRFDAPWARGRALFSDLGCVLCHRPMLVLDDPVLVVRVGAHETAIDLSQTGREPRLYYDVALGGYPVWLFSDLRRHDLGEENRSQHVHRGVARSLYQTRRLWGLANSGPYLHDGRAPDLDTAIAGHGGEAAFAREGFHALSYDDKGALRVYLLSLRRAWTLTIP